MAEEFFPFDPAEVLNSREAIEYFLAEVFKSGDADYIAKALSIVARAKIIHKLEWKEELAPEDAQSK
jgi:probable addiction module antidote protein